MAPPQRFQAHLWRSARFQTAILSNAFFINAHLLYIKGCPNSIANSLPSARCGGRPKAAIGDAGSCAIWRAAEGRLDAVALCLIAMRFGFENIVLESSFVPNCD